MPVASSAMSAGVGRRDPKDFQFRNRQGEHLSRAAGEIGGLDFLVDGCEDCEILILDHSSQVFIDYCKRCTIVIGPVSGPIFIRNCEGIRLAVACGQLRTRDCNDCDVLVLVPGRPTIESSRNMRFGPLLASYEAFSEHADNAGLAKRLFAGEPCRWRNVYDFSAQDHRPEHWRNLSRAEAEQLSAGLPVAATCGGPVSLPRDNFPEGEDLRAPSITAIKALDPDFTLERPRAGPVGAPIAPLAPAMPAVQVSLPNSLRPAATAPVVGTCSHCGAQSAKLMLCSGCLAASYCGPDCQRAAWKGGHKKLCKT